jgi:hypothetical protein
MKPGEGRGDDVGELSRTCLSTTLDVKQSGVGSGVLVIEFARSSQLEEVLM